MRELNKRVATMLLLFFTYFLFGQTYSLRIDVGHLQNLSGSFSFINDTFYIPTMFYETWSPKVTFSTSLMATANMGASAASILLNCSAPLDIVNFRNEQEVSFFPNPASNTISLNVEGINFQNSTITIQNTLGETIKKLLVSNVELSKNIPVSDLPEGCYFLQITLSNGERYKTKLVVSN